ncbi:MAG TPA: hypothetical protein PK926_05365 [Spirochaetota bacterium]|nr:hypothetical protein [Spirochaetota bacterium]HPI89285.1 hypothetical protein [Spirochaetota bacterium]HPR48555.1 hypothetical protein [Spirochaetota bacterium]
MQKTEAIENTGATSGQESLHETEREPVITGNGSGGVISEILATPFIKEMLRESINSARSSSSRDVIKNIMWQDMEFFFSMIGALPLIVNSVISAVEEMGAQIDDKIEPGLLRDYMGEVIGGIDTASVSRALAVYGGMMSKLMELDDVRAKIIALVRDSLASSLGRGVNSSLRTLNRLQEHDPAFMRDSIKSVVREIDSREAGRAIMAVVNPALDRISFTGMAWCFITSRIAYKFRRKGRKPPVR